MRARCLHCGSRGPDEQQAGVLRVNLPVWVLELFPQFQEPKIFRERLEYQTHQAGTWRTEAESTAKINATLRDEIAELKTEKIMLQDRLESAIADKSHLWTMVMHSLDSERQSLRMQVNELAKAKWGTTPYPEAWAPPDGLSRNPNASKEAMGRSIMMPSDMVRKHAMQTLEDAIAKQMQGT